MVIKCNFFLFSSGNFPDALRLNWKRNENNKVKEAENPSFLCFPLYFYLLSAPSDHNKTIPFSALIVITHLNEWDSYNCVDHVQQDFLVGRWRMIEIKDSLDGSQRGFETLQTTAFHYIISFVYCVAFALNLLALFHPFNFTDVLSWLLIVKENLYYSF